MECCCCSYLVVLALIVVILVALRRYMAAGMFHADGAVMEGKTVIVTGASAGIGLETTAELVRYGGKVIMACRDMRKAAQAKEAIIERLKSQGILDAEARLVVEELDLASFDSIRAFATRMLNLPRLDVLIDNGGVIMDERKLTKDGLEMTMGTNHFGHFLLTNLLLPLLKKSAPSRVVVVSSVMHWFGKIDFSDLNSERSFRPMKAYSNSKLANVLFTRELARKLEGTGVVVNVLHPGAVRTIMARQSVGIFAPVTSLYSKTPLEGAQTTVFLAASQSPSALQSGQYFADCGVAWTSGASKDVAVAKKLWEVSERLTKLA